MLCPPNETEYLLKPSLANKGSTSLPLLKNFMNYPTKLMVGNCLPALVLALIVSGCKTINSTSVTNFATTVTAVKTQADDALNSASILTLNESVTYAASQPTLQEANFIETPTADTISQWDNALSAMETYAQILSTLLSPNAVNNFDVAATNLFNQFNQTANTLNLTPKSPGAQSFTLLATAFTQVAASIIQAKEETTAVKIAAATDASITNICYLLANEIGPDRLTTPGLRKTLNETAWVPDLANLNVSFLNAKTPAEKLTISQQYAALLAKRDAEDQILASLRRSLLLLSDAHHALAQGQPASIQANLNVVASEIQHTRALYGQFSSITNR
jgi:hypothetical protein